jgi:hypothetical protein
MTRAPARRASCTAHTPTANDPPVWHAVPKGILSFLDVAGIDARRRDPDPQFTRPWSRIGHDADLQHLAGGTLRFVKCCAHQLPKTRHL